MASSIDIINIIIFIIIIIILNSNKEKYLNWDFFDYKIDYDGEEIGCVALLVLC